MCFSTSTVIKVSVLSFVSVLDKHGPLLSNLPAELVPVPVLTEDYCNTSTSMSTSQYQYQHRLIASEAYLSTGVWSRAHFPAPLEQPLVGRLPEPHQISNLFRDSFRSMRRIYVWAHWSFPGFVSSFFEHQLLNWDKPVLLSWWRWKNTWGSKGLSIENGLWEFRKKTNSQDCFQFSGSLVLLGPGPARGAGAGYWCGTPAPAPRCTILHHATSSCTREKYHHTPEK